MQRVIIEIMEDYNLEPEDVDGRHKRQSVHGRGKFTCKNCHITWSSYITWVTIDLRGQCIRRRFKQKCKTCNRVQRPWWDVEEFEVMVDFAIRRYLKLRDGTWKPRSQSQKSKNAPHLSELCERCEYGQKKCWEATPSSEE